MLRFFFKGLEGLGNKMWMNDLFTNFAVKLFTYDLLICRRIMNGPVGYPMCYPRLLLFSHCPLTTGFIWIKLKQYVTIAVTFGSFLHQSIMHISFLLGQNILVKSVYNYKTCFSPLYFYLIRRFSIFLKIPLFDTW